MKIRKALLLYLGDFTIRKTLPLYIHLRDFSICKGPLHTTLRDLTIREDRILPNREEAMTITMITMVIRLGIMKLKQRKSIGVELNERDKLRQLETLRRRRQPRTLTHHWRVIPVRRCLQSLHRKDRTTTWAPDLCIRSRDLIICTEIQMNINRETRTHH